MRVVWFDDEIDDALGQFLPGALAGLGIELTPIAVYDSKSMTKGVEEAIQLEPSMAIVDMRLGQGTGLVFGTALIQFLSAHWIGPIILLTRYPKHAELSNFIDPRLSLVEVIKPDEGDLLSLERWFEKELAPDIRQLISEQGGGSIVDRPRSEEVGSYLGLSLEEFGALDFLVQMEAQLRCGKVLIDEFQPCFDDPEVSYLVVCGSPAHVVRVGRTSDEAPGAESLRETQKRHRSVVLTLRRPAVVNVLSVHDPTPCAPSAGPAKQSAKYADWFPALPVEIRDEEFKIHVDTGSDYTFLGYENLGSVAPNRNNAAYWSVMDLQVGVGPRRTLQVSEWKVDIGAKSRSGHLHKTIPTQLVFNFQASGLAVECRSSCPSSGPDQPLCRFRPGLLGRDLFRHTGWVFVADTIGQRAFVVEADDELLLGHKSRRKWL